MGIFDFLMKRNEDNGNSNLTDKYEIEKFYNKCVDDFHNTAKESDVANRDIIFIPELIPVGSKIVLAFLKDDFFQMSFGKDPKTYYYVMLSLSIESGIIMGKKWHEDYSGLDSDYINRIIKLGPADLCNKILEEEFSPEIAYNQGNGFFSKIYERWLILNEPYWELKDPRQYTFKALLAGYQLGISMILEKYGY